MKNLFLAILFCFLNILSFSNDWEFGSEGEHIIPLKGSNMSIKKEKITLQLTKDGMIVNVKFVFDNPNAENKIIGFVTPESGNIEKYEENKENRKAEPLKIKNFKTIVNGNEVKSNVVLLSKLLSKGILDNKVVREYKEKEKNLYNYVYYFNADFKEGENIVEHNYFYTGSHGIFERDFTYIVTTISKWKDQTVEDFEIEVHPGNYFVKLPYTFWSNIKKVDWKIVGKGKIASIAPTNPNDEDGYGVEKYGVVFLKLDNGYVRYKTKNFSPDNDLYAIHMTIIPGFDYEFPEGTVQGYKFKDEYLKFMADNIGYYKEKEIINSLRKFSNKELDIIRNYPYALVGYDFDRKDLKEYFSQFFWYSPVSKNVEIYPFYDRVIKIVDKVKETRKK